MCGAVPDPIRQLHSFAARFKQLIPVTHVPCSIYIPSSYIDCGTALSPTECDAPHSFVICTITTVATLSSQVPDSVVTKLCEEGTVLQCAGGLMVEHKLVQPYITNMDGTMDSVMGLSKSLVLELLARLTKS